MNQEIEYWKYINLDEIEPYPIQFANSDRLRENDAVYIFDEVGSGKTISSGIMALEYLCYLCRNDNDKVLVITTNALAKGGQFKRDWFQKLPFESLGLCDRVEVVNNHYSKFNRSNQYGLVIIDEAHLFLNKDTKRYEQLIQNVRACKVVFLTATPIKQTHEDLYTYVEIAESIINKGLPEEKKDWIQEISTTDKKKEDIICNKFDVKFPVTRYFKDTIMALNIDEFKKTQARRLLPHLWKYSRRTSESKIEVLWKNLRDLSDIDPQNRFVIFTRFVGREADTIREYLCGNGFECFAGRTDDGQKTVKVVTGENAEELKQFQDSDRRNLPTVLILTYQIAEQGVNLPGFNYVINYHISSFPSALEQRFGRIDRMGKRGSVFSEIHMCFLIVEDSYYPDTNTLNFYTAVRIYMSNLITHLPSKNAMISEEILDSYGQMEKIVRNHVSQMKAMLQQENVINSLKEYLAKQDEPIGDVAEKQEIIEIYSFMEEHSIELHKSDQNVSDDEAMEELIKEIEMKLKEIEGLIKLKEGESIEPYKDIVKKIGDKIFYMKSENISDITNETLETIDAIECGSMISGNNSYIEYSKKFQERIQIPLRLKECINEYKYDLSHYFEQLFIHNDTRFVFPLGGYRDIFTEMFEKPEFDHIPKDKKKLLTEYNDIVVRQLPFFRMCDEFGEILQGWYFRKSFDFNPFASAVGILGDRIRWDVDRKGLSEEFVNTYWKNEEDGQLYEKIYKGLFGMEDSNAEDASGMTVKATNWSRLAYHYTGIMSKKILCYKKDYDLLVPASMSSDDDLKADLLKIHNMYKKCNSDGEDYRTYFEYYIFTETGHNYRTHVKDWQSMFLYNSEPGIDPADIWTQGIYYELQHRGYHGD